jgi:hypothetical protein
MAKFSILGGREGKALIEPASIKKDRTSVDCVVGDQQVHVTIGHAQILVEKIVEKLHGAGRHLLRMRVARATSRPIPPRIPKAPLVGLKPRGYGTAIIIGKRQKLTRSVSRASISG